MGSRIEVDSHVDQGSCFRFDLELPIEPVSTQLAVAAPRRVVTGYVGARRRVLVVDDIAADRMPLLDLADTSLRNWGMRRAWNVPLGTLDGSTASAALSGCSARRG